MDRNDSCPAVSQICNLICLSAMEIMRAPNSTPIVRSWTGWKRLSVNWRRRHDLPTPVFLFVCRFIFILGCSVCVWSWIVQQSKLEKYLWVSSSYLLFYK